MKHVDGIYLMSESKLPPERLEKIVGALRGIAEGLGLKILMAHSPPVIEEGPYYCDRCKETAYVTEARVSRVPVPECVFCGKTDKVRSMAE